jgi:Tol biopolymer transport system component
MTLDARATGAAEGIHRAVAVMEMGTMQGPRDLERFDRFRARRSRNRRIGAVVVGIAVPLAVIVGWIFLSSDTPKVAGRGTQQSLSPSSGKPVFVDLRTGVITPLPDILPDSNFPYEEISSFRPSPDGTKLAFGKCCSSAGPTFIANVDGTGVRRVSPDIAVGASWSPDGSMLVYQGFHWMTDPGNLFVAALNTGEVRQITDFPPSKKDWWFMWPSFAPDGSTILFHMPRPHIGPSGQVWDLWSVPVSGGEPVLVRRNAGFGTYSPDGGTLAYLSPMSSVATGDDRGTIKPGQSALWVVDAGGGLPLALVAREGLRWPTWSPDGTMIAYGVGTNEIDVVDVATGQSTKVAEGGTAEWLDDHMLIVTQCCRG